MDSKLTMIPVVCGFCKEQVYIYERHASDQDYPIFTGQRRFYNMYDESEPDELVHGYTVNCPACGISWSSWSGFTFGRKTQCTLYSQLILFP